MIDRDTVISIHEAGHAVISRVLQLPSGAATIDGEPPLICRTTTTSPAC